MDDGGGGGRELISTRDRYFRGSGLVCRRDLFFRGLVVIVDFYVIFI